MFDWFYISRALVLQVALAFCFRADEAQAGEQIHQAICEELHDPLAIESRSRNFVQQWVPRKQCVSGE
jgi:hypothetical protein